jgi:hypothetical protein
LKYRDYEEFVESLNQSGARYLIDLLLEPTRENAERVLTAIREFLGTDLGLSGEDLSAPGRIAQIGVAPSRIDLLAGISGNLATCPVSSVRLEVEQNQLVRGGAWFWLGPVRLQGQ